MKKSIVVLTLLMSFAASSAPPCPQGSKYEKSSTVRMKMLCKTGDPDRVGALSPCSCDVQVSWCRYANGTSTHNADVYNASNCSSSNAGAVIPVKPAPGSEALLKQGNISSKQGLSIDNGMPKINASPEGYSGSKSAK